jgi:cyclic pyranopterin phosphate synthase
MTKLSHIDNDGKAKMVDVGGKDNSLRTATVTAEVLLSQTTFDLVKSNKLAKGDVLTTAKLAGIQAAKKTAELIPLCHQINLNHVDILFDLNDAKSKIIITTTVTTSAPTGVEMEAFCGCSIAAVTIYDMVKAVQKDVVISEIKLIHKKGGKSGEFKRTDI